MLARLLRTHLRPYRAPLAAVVVLQLVGTIASLYLPSLNAEIIDRGIAAGDTGLILRLGGLMLLISLVQVACSIAAVHHGARTATGFGARRAGLGLPPRRGVLDAGGGAVRRAVADHPMHERRPAGADARAHLLHDAGRRADHVHRRDRHGAARRPRAVVAGRGVRPGAGRGDRRDRRPDGAPVPPDAVDDRRGQPGAARADRRDPGGAGVRPRAAGDGAVREGQRGPHGGGHQRRPAAGADLPGGPAGAQRVERRGAVVRRPAGRRGADADRRADGVPGLPAADPHRGHDGHLHRDDDPAGGGVRRTHRRGARHASRRSFCPPRR